MKFSCFPGILHKSAKKRVFVTFGQFDQNWRFLRNPRNSRNPEIHVFAVFADFRVFTKSQDSWNRENSGILITWWCNIVAWCHDDIIMLKSFITLCIIKLFLKTFIVNKFIQQHKKLFMLSCWITLCYKFFIKIYLLSCWNQPPLSIDSTW